MKRRSGKRWRSGGSGFARSCERIKPLVHSPDGECTVGEDPPLLALSGITRRFPGVRALDRVDFELRRGEVHVLFGENGAGKSTLISVAAGALRPHGGTIRFRGEVVDLASVHHARTLGISAVFQEFSLVPELTVEQNLFLGAEETSFGMLANSRMRQRASEVLERLGFSLNPGQRVAFLSRAEQQMVEIAKAFRSELSVLILDEPTASLTERETDRLFTLVEQVKKEGVGVIYITHRINEIWRIGDRITVLRDGRRVATVDARTSVVHSPPGECTERLIRSQERANVVHSPQGERTEGSVRSQERANDLVHLMTGRVIGEMFPRIRHAPGETILEVEHLIAADGFVNGVSFRVRRGEVVGLAGLVGSGKSEVARACFGLVPVSGGRVSFAGEVVTGRAPRQMLDRGFFYVPADRRDEGLMMMRSVRENVALPALSTPAWSRGLLLRRREESARTRELAERLDLRPLRIERQVGHFSGGNQQKVLLAKSLTRDVGLFAFDEPTVGVDVATRVAIYGFIRDLCEAGAAVLLISSDLPEILHLPHRVYVMCRGVLTAELRERTFPRRTCCAAASSRRRHEPHGHTAREPERAGDRRARHRVVDSLRLRSARSPPVSVAPCGARVRGPVRQLPDRSQPPQRGPTVRVSHARLHGPDVRAPHGRLRPLRRNHSRADLRHRRKRDGGRLRRNARRHRSFHPAGGHGRGRRRHRDRRDQRNRRRPFQHLALHDDLGDGVGRLRPRPLPDRGDAGLRHAGGIRGRLRVRGHPRDSDPGSRHHRPGRVALPPGQPDEARPPLLRRRRQHQGREALWDQHPFHPLSRLRAVRSDGGDLRHSADRTPRHRRSEHRGDDAARVDRRVRDRRREPARRHRTARERSPRGALHRARPERNEPRPDRVLSADRGHWRAAHPGRGSGSVPSALPREPCATDAARTRHRSLSTDPGDTRERR